MSTRFPAVLARYGSPEAPSEVACESLYAQGPIEFTVWRHPAPVCLVVMLKRTFMRHYVEAIREMPAVFVATSFPVDRRFTDLIGGYRQTGGLPIGFVGDLDPHALCQFLALSEGNPAGVPVLESAAWLGVESKWLEVCERYSSTMPSLIEMGEDERQLLRELDSQVDLEAIVGSRAAGLLRSGRKLEIEGASADHPAAYDEGFADAMLEHVAGLVESR